MFFILNFKSIIQKIKSLYRFFKKSHFIVGALSLFLLFGALYFGISITLKTVQIKGELNSLYGSRTITVTGEATIQQSPEVAIVVFKIQKQAPRLETAQQSIKQNIKRFADFLQGLDIPSKNINLFDYNIFIQRSNNTDSSLHAGQIYIISQKIQVKTKDFKKLGAIFRMAGNLSLSEANEIKFGPENNMLAINEAREQAIRNAQAKARRISKQLGVKLKRIINLYESDTSSPQGCTCPVSGLTHKAYKKVIITYAIQ